MLENNRCLLCYAVACVEITKTSSRLGEFPATTELVPDPSDLIYQLTLKKWNLIDKVDWDSLWQTLTQLW